MNIFAAIIEAIESLTSNKLRSGLTIIGIVIGVAAVIAIISVGRGAENTITGSIQGIGTNLLFVMESSTKDVRNPQPLTLADADAIGDVFQAPSVAGVAPVLMGSVKVSVGGETTQTSVEGVTPSYSPVRNLNVIEGEFINQEHVIGQASVVLVGQAVAENLFGRVSGLIGESIRVEGRPFRIIGILESKGGSGFANEDDRILVPLSTAQTRLIRRQSRNEIDMLVVQATDPERVNLATEEISQILRTRHRTQIGEDDFRVLSQQDILSTAQTITNVFTIFLGGIAAISLLVGGIGIMNIMLVSVTERTREIGLRKALGARKSDILVQFLTESSLLSLFGGLIGIGLGAALSYVIGQIATAQNAPIDPSISLDIVLLATLFSTAVGLFFGLYPANRAANLTPVEALRYE